VRVAVLTLCVVGLTLLAGCAFQHGKYYNPDGQLCAHTYEVVIGTGETETVTEVVDCAKITHSTSDTGISEHATELGGKIAEGAVKGAAKSIVPKP
jgi:hypothetical protein